MYTSTLSYRLFLNMVYANDIINGGVISKVSTAIV